MRDSMAWRKKFGVLGPSTNTIVQPDFDDLRVPGVTNHYSRIFTPNSHAVSNETFLAGTKKISEGVLDAVRSVMTCEPDYMVMGMSAITFYDGMKGANDFQRMVESEAKVGVSIGSHACAAALKAYGAKSLSFMSPYYPVANAEVRRYFTEAGFKVVRDVPMQAPSWTGIAEITTDQCRETLMKLDGPDVDAIVQVGTNLSMIRLAAAAEMWLNKPVIAINTATYWHALRANGINDKVDGFGRLMSDF
jgi:maleate isomerase